MKRRGQAPAVGQNSLWQDEQPEVRDNAVRTPSVEVPSLPEQDRQQIAWMDAAREVLSDRQLRLYRVELDETTPQDAPSLLTLERIVRQCKLCHSHSWMLAGKEYRCAQCNPPLADSLRQWTTSWGAAHHFAAFDFLVGSGYGNDYRSYAIPQGVEHWRIFRQQAPVEVLAKAQHAMFLSELQAISIEVIERSGTWQVLRNGEVVDTWSQEHAERSARSYAAFWRTPQGYATRFGNQDQQYFRATDAANPFADGRWTDRGGAGVSVMMWEPACPTCGGYAWTLRTDGHLHCTTCEPEEAPRFSEPVSKKKNNRLSLS